MTPENKAKELVDKYWDITISMDELDYTSAKQCALIAVDEILNVLFQHHKIDYWKQVKEEIEKM